ncbi:hypothetical protein M2273_001352 [Mucilaginibacter lappiensis]
MLNAVKHLIANMQILGAHVMRLYVLIVETHHMCLPALNDLFRIGFMLFFTRKPLLRLPG